MYGNYSKTYGDAQGGKFEKIQARDPRPTPRGGFAITSAETLPAHEECNIQRNSAHGCKEFFLHGHAARV